MRASRQAALPLPGAALLLAGCSVSCDDPGEGEQARPALPARTATPGKWEEGPADPVRHKPYPYDLFTHCGIKWLRFDGRWWVLDTVFPDAAQVAGEPPAQGGQVIAGYMTLIDADTANFDAAGLPSLQFVPAKKTPPGCA